MRFHWGIASKAKRLFISSPTKSKAVNGRNPVGEFDYQSKPVDSSFGSSSPGFGNKEEIFFDSRAWLDSDCEDDFVSVNGDFTPSRGSTPNYQISTPVTAQLTKPYFINTFPDTKSEPSPTEGKKKLADLLLETLRGEPVSNEQNAVAGKVEINGKPDVYKIETDQPPKSADGTPHLSGKVTPYRDSKHRKEKSEKTKHCCMPSLVHSLGFSDRRKQKMSPER